MVETDSKSQSDCMSRTAENGSENRAEMKRMRSKNLELEAKLREYESIMETKCCPPKMSALTSKPNRGEEANDIIEDVEQRESLKVAPRALAKGSSIVLKSPIPRQRKSKSKTSKAERLKSRLAPKCPPPSKEQLEELLQSNFNSNSLSSTTSIGSSTAIYSNSTSGFSSSRSLAEDGEKFEDRELEERIVTPRDLKQRLGLYRDSTLANESSEKWPSVEEHYKLCQCADCRLSGQQIYCQQKSAETHSLRGQQRQVRPPTPPRVVPRKAVSFRSSVEQIGSPNCRPLNDQVERQANLRLPTFDEQLDWLRFNGQQQVMGGRMNDSCDSLHATKDFSLISDQIRPLNCSTPKPDEQPSESGQQLATIEVHNQRPAESTLAADYTCLCSPDFNCIHNYPERYQQQQQLEQPLGNGSSQFTEQNPVFGERQKSGAISNELYGRCPAISVDQVSSSQVVSNYSLSKDCAECNNISTYVNLSNGRVRNETASLDQPQSNELQFARGLTVNDSLRNVTNSSGDSNGGYGSCEYKNLIRSKQEGVYGNWSAGAHMQQEQEQKIESRGQYRYLSAARQIQQAIEECEMCQQDQRIQLLQANASSIVNGNNISLKPNGAQMLSNQKLHPNSAIMVHNNQHQTIDLSSSKSYHTASSSSLPNCREPASASNQHPAIKRCTTSGSKPHMAMTNNVSSLSVLPFNQTVSNSTEAGSNLHESLMANKVQRVDANCSAANLAMNSQQLDGNDLLDSSMQAANIDSSLASLFVYRHVSDDNQDEFDPDSLEASRLTTNLNQANNYKTPSATTTKAATTKPTAGNDNPQLSARPASSSTRMSWLKTRPKSEYISLSSTTNTSNISSAPSSVAVKPQAANKSASTNQQTGGKSGKTATATNCVQVDSDLTQSSLARRRHLSNSLQNQQQQQSGAKRRLLAASKVNSRSSPNIAAASGAQSTVSKSGRNHSRSSSSFNTSASASSSSNVKTIYQCFKNHILDLTCKSSSSAQSASNSNSKSNISASASSLPRNPLSSGGLQRSKSQQISKPLDDAIQRRPELDRSKQYPASGSILRGTELIRMEGGNLPAGEQLAAASRESVLNDSQGQLRNPQPQASSGELRTKLDKAVGVIKSLQESSVELKRELMNSNERNRILVDQNQQLIQALRLAELNFHRQQQQHENREREFAAFVDTKQQQQVQNVSSPRDSLGEKAANYTADENELLRRQVNQLNQLSAKLETDLRKKSNELEQQQQINRQIEKLLDGSQCELANVRMERNQSRVQLEKVIIELERRNCELANLRAQLGEFERNLRDKQDELLYFQRQLNGREQLLEGKQEELQSLRKQLRRHQQTLLSVGQLQQLEGQVANLQQQTKSLEEEKLKLQSELELSRAELERLLKVLSDNDDEKFNLTRELEELRTRFESKVKINHRHELDSENKHNTDGSEELVVGQPLRRSSAKGQNEMRGRDEGESYSVMNNMHLIELALRESINWSMSYWCEQAQRAGCSVDDNRAKISGRDSEKLMNAPKSIKNEQPTVDPETHMRALVSRFTIELNNLLGMKKANAGSLSIECGKPIDLTSRSKSVGSVLARNKEDCRRKSIAGSIPKQAIQITGKHSGLYKIAELTDDDDEADEEEEQEEDLPEINIPDGASKLKNRILDRRQSSSSDQAVLDQQGGFVEGTNQAAYCTDVDDGYRSLSRNDFRSNLVQQLNEIKSRLIDLVDEIESSVRSYLECEQLDAYRRRQHALISKVDQLIDSMAERVDSSIDLLPINHNGTMRADENNASNRLIADEERQDLQPSSSYSTSTCSSSSGTSSLQSDGERRLLITKSISVKRNNQGVDMSESTSDGYEEQVQTIDYERRPGSTRKLNQIIGTSQEVKPINFVRHDHEQPVHKRQSLIVHSNMSRIENGTNYSNNLCLSRMEPIDFGAMMRNYERQNGTQIMFSEQNYDKSKLYNLTNNQNSNEEASASGSIELATFNAGQHAPSSSTTSTFSASSHTSSTSSFL